VVEGQTFQPDTNHRLHRNERDCSTSPQNTGRELNLLSVTDGVTSKIPSGDSKEEFSLAGQHREFELHIPKGYDGHSKLPIVYMMHGLTENMDMMREYSTMDKVADEKGFAVAYLQALPQQFPGLPFYQETSWNMDHGTLTPRDPSYNDLDYFKAVKNEVEHSLPIDSQKEFIAGFSEGGQAAQYIAHEMPGTIAGIASVHGTLLESDPRPNKNESTSMLSILGNDDDILPLKGGHGWGEDWAPLKGWRLLTVSKIVESQPLEQAPAWAKANGDNTIRQTHTPAEDDTFYTGGSAHVEQIIRLKHKEADHVRRGGEHAWDGGDGGWNDSHPDLLTYISRPVREPDPEFDTSRTVADFFFQNSAH
jgi:poly(3-hydroxybutyrate) depolymerase